MGLFIVIIPLMPGFSVFHYRNSHSFNYGILTWPKTAQGGRIYNTKYPHCTAFLKIQNFMNSETCLAPNVTDYTPAVIQHLLPKAVLRIVNLQNASTVPAHGRFFSGVSGCCQPSWTNPMGNNAPKTFLIFIFFSFVSQWMYLPLFAHVQ